MRCKQNDFTGYRPAGRRTADPALLPGLELVSAEALACAHSMGLEVHVWTVNEEQEMEGLLDLGIDGIMSDYPGRAAYMFSRRGLDSRTRGLE
jgi:glycerophosphoryl diester phosphodiesterase